MIKINKALKLGKMLVSVWTIAKSPGRETRTSLDKLVENRLSVKYDKLSK